MSVAPAPTKRDLILAAIRAAVAPLAPEVQVEPPGDPSDFPAIGMYDHGDEAIGREAMLTRWSMAITIDGVIQGSGGDAPTAERNRLDAAIVAAVMADDQLGGLVENIEPGDRNNSTAVLAEAKRLSFTRDFEITWTSLRVDPARGA